MLVPLHHLVWIALLCLLWSSQLIAQSPHKWEVQLHQEHNAHFKAAYQAYPKIPKGMLEAIAYTNTHMRHIRPQQEALSCVSLPAYYGVMGLVLAPDGHFRSSLATVAQLSGYALTNIQEQPSINILAFAKAYNQLMQDFQITTTAPEAHLPIIDALSELPNDGDKLSNFAFDSHVYSILMNLNHPTFQGTYQLPSYQIDLEKVFGSERYAVLSASALVLDQQGLRTSTGQVYQQEGLRSAPPPCSDISGSFPYPVLQDAADPSNYSSRQGQAITHITIHTMQGSYAASISWFKMAIANVSAHYNMRAADGQITQMVCEIDKAWHVSNSNPYAVGIEHEGFIDDPSWYTDITYVVSASLTKDIAARHGIPIIRTYDVNGDNGINPIGDGCFKIKGHQHFPSQTHVDPGQYWDWNRYYDLINTPSAAPKITYTNCNGSFFDPGGNGGNYGNDERRFYHIAPTGATSVTLNFTAFDLETNFDYLYVYDGDSHHDALLAVLNGNSIPASITASSGQLLLEFRSDCATTNAGWEANWTCSTTPVSCAAPTNLTALSQSPNSATFSWDAIAGANSYELKVKQSIGNLGYTTYYTTNNNYLVSGLATDAQYLWSVRTICGSGDTSVSNGAAFVHAQTSGDETTTACSGNFTDHGGPLGKYAKNEDYTFTISPSNASSVSLTFTAFDVEANYDYLYIYDGNSISAPLLGTYTGTTLPPTTTSSGGSLTIRFTSDNATQNAGWEANWTCVSSLPTYPNPVLLDSSMIGHLNCGIAFHDYYDSGNTTGFYSNGENHIQTFCNPDTTKAIRLSFRPNPTAAQQLDISSTTDGNDYLYFYNGADTTANLIGVYTGASSNAPQPGTFVSSGACLTVKMESNGNFVGDGWIARLYCADPPSNLGTVEVGGSEGTKTFADLGGNAANYNNNENYTVTYCPHSSAPSGEVVWAEFINTAGLEQSWDYLYVFDGTNTDQSRLICAYTGNGSNQNTLTTIKASVENASGCLTFQFFSDGATTAAGWEANVFTGVARLPFGGENCTNATLINQTGKDYAGSNAISTGMPGNSDPSLDIALASLPECSGTNTITRLENTVWYRFITPDTLCIPTSMHIRINNISCQGEGNNGSGVQFVLYESNNCFSGNNWPTPIYCADKLTSGDSVDVANLLQPNQSYYIMIDGFTGQHCNFDLRFDVTTMGDPNSCVLPLELLGFWGKAFPNKNQLTWETAHEDNVFGFHIQRTRLNSTDFEDIGFIPSNPSTMQQGGHYLFDDPHYFRNQVNYYRLRQVDNDGLQSFSPIVSIDRRQNQQEVPIKVYPNPAKAWITFALNNPEERPYQLEIFDLTGRLLHHQEGLMAAGYWTEQLNTTMLAAGTYAYRLQIGIQSSVGKFEKN